MPSIISDILVNEKNNIKVIRPLTFDEFAGLMKDLSESDARIIELGLVLQSIYFPSWNDVVKFIALTTEEGKKLTKPQQIVILRLAMIYDTIVDLDFLCPGLSTRKEEFYRDFLKKVGEID